MGLTLMWPAFNLYFGRSFASFIAPGWQVLVVHIFREANRCVDAVASHRHHGVFSWVTFDSATAYLNLLLFEDSVGCSGCCLLCFFLFVSKKLFIQ